MLNSLRQFAFLFLGLLTACGSQASSATPPPLGDSGSSSGSDSSTADATSPPPAQGDASPPADVSTEAGGSVPDASLDATGTADSSMADAGPVVGATTPFVSYEAEDGTLGEARPPTPCSLHLRPSTRAPSSRPRGMPTWR